jgi:NTE family protein
MGERQRRTKIRHEEPRGTSAAFHDDAKAAYPWRSMMAAMTSSRHALVLQGGGALGAFELGVARAVYAEESRFRPDVVAGVSIGAITAALLARPAPGLEPLEALEAFWRDVTVSRLFPEPVQPYLSLFGTPNFYAINPFALFGTSLYGVEPLRATLTRLVDLDRLADPAAHPRILVTATDIAKGQLATFQSDLQPLSLDHILASGSLPPSFPMTQIGQVSYWDGGVFDNTPLGAVIDMLDDSAPDRAILVINLFPNTMPLPTNLADVSQAFSNLLFVNKTRGDVALMKRFNLVADLMAELQTLPEDSPVRGLPSFGKMLDQHYQHVPNIIEVTRASPARSLEGSDFSSAGIERRAAEGLEKARAELRQAGFI